MDIRNLCNKLIKELFYLIIYLLIFNEKNIEINLINNY